MPIPVLITNDDGYDALGLDVLATATYAHDRYTATLVAPARNQSGKGQAVSITPIAIRPWDLGATMPGFLIEGTPADCVRLGIASVLIPPVSLVLSGINCGWNLGSARFSSGTVGAAREAAVHGIPAIAFSAPMQATWDALFLMVSQFLPEWSDWALAHPGYFLSINLPSQHATQWRWTHPTTDASVRFQTGQTPEGDLQVRWVYADPVSPAIDSDTMAVYNGIISVTAFAALERTDVPVSQPALKHQGMIPLVSEQRFIKPEGVRQ